MTCRAGFFAPALPGASKPSPRSVRSPFFGGTAPLYSSFRARSSSVRCTLAVRSDAESSSRTSRLAPRATAESTLERVAEAPGDLPAEQSAVEPEQGEQDFSWHDQWWPCVFVKDLDPQKPYPFTLLGEPIVIWRDGAGAWHAFHDACPHRLIPLSEGRISTEGQLECAYHGWRFEGGGRCTAMPQGGNPASPRACASAYQCQVKQGLVWVKPQPSSVSQGPDAALASDIPTLPELDDGEWLGFGDMWRDLPYDYSTLLENVLDAGHVPFTHHGTVSKRQSSGLYQDMRITERGPWGFKGVWPTGPRRGGLGSQSTHFRAPSLMRHTIDALDNRGFANITAVYAVPTTPGRCRAFVRQPFRFRNRLLPQLLDKLPQFLGHLGNLDVLDDDVVFLHLQEQELVKRGMGERPAGQVYYMPGASDAYVSGFRNWLQRVGGGGPFGPQNKEWLQAAGSRLPVKDLLDHYHSHTEQCETCRTALGRLRVLRVVAAVGAAVSGLAAIACLGLWLAVTRLPAFQSMVPSAGVPLLLHGAWVSAVIAAGVGTLASWCQRTIPRFYTGKHPPARNTVPGEWAP